jgi:hypothetical protein
MSVDITTKKIKFKKTLNHFQTFTLISNLFKAETTNILTINRQMQRLHAIIFLNFRLDSILKSLLPTFFGFKIITIVIIRPTIDKLLQK